MQKIKCREIQLANGAVITHGILETSKGTKVLNTFKVTALLIAVFLSALPFLFNYK